MAGLLWRVKKLAIDVKNGGTAFSALDYRAMAFLLSIFGLKPGPVLARVLEIME